MDPASRKKMTEIRETYVDVENKLTDVTTLLDAEWKATQVQMLPLLFCLVDLLAALLVRLVAYSYASWHVLSTVALLPKLKQLLPYCQY